MWLKWCNFCLIVQKAVGKGENAGFQNILFPQCFSKGFLFKVMKTWNYFGKGIHSLGFSEIGLRSVFLDKSLSRDKILD